VWAVAAGCCGSAAGQVNGAIGGHQHTQTTECLAGLPQLAGTGQLVTENDRAVQTSVETISTTAVPGYTTYQITLHLASSALNCYTIYGDSRPMLFPPAYQVPSPFGTNVGGVSPAFFALNALAQYDSWLTVGETSGNTDNHVNSVGIDFTLWTDQMPLLSSVDSGGAVFWMDPDGATQAVGSQGTMVVAQLTLQDAASQSMSQAAHFDAQGRSAGFVVGAHNNPSDWEENCIEVLVGGPQHGQGSHSVMASNTAPAVPGGACRMKTNPQGGSWSYDTIDFRAGTRATLSCMRGYSPPVGANLQEVCTNGQWGTSPTAVCNVDLPCTAMPNPTAGTYTYASHTYASGSHATLTCAYGYQISSGNAVKVCQSGSWVADITVNPTYSDFNFASCVPAQAGQGGQYALNGHQAFTSQCASKQAQYLLDPCFQDQATYDQRNQQQCSAQGSRCMWVVDLTVDGGRPIPGRGLSCEHCASATRSGAKPPQGPASGNSGGGGGGSNAAVWVILVILGGGAYYAHDKKLGPFAPAGDKASSLTAGGGSTIYDTQTDESL
jgi:hypothetical protein